MWDLGKVYRVAGLDAEGVAEAERLMLQVAEGANEKGRKKAKGESASWDFRLAPYVLRHRSKYFVRGSRLAETRACCHTHLSSFVFTSIVAELSIHKCIDV